MAKSNKKEVIYEDENQVVEDVKPEEQVQEPVKNVSVNIDSMLNEVTEMQEPSPDLNLGGIVGDVPEEPADIYTDASGELWDDTKHATGSDGKPIYTVKGFFRKRRSYSGRAESTETVACRKAGEIAAIAFTQFGVALFGEEWQPIQNENENEREILVGAFSDYFTAKGIIDIPPGVVLCIAIGGYSIRRIGKPQTKSRLGKARDFLRSKLGRFRIRKPKMKAKDKQPTAFDELKS